MKISRLFLRIICFIWILAGLVEAADKAGQQTDSLDEIITRLMAERQIPGLSLAIIQDGAIITAKGYGVIEAGGTVPVTTDTLFQAGSVSKSVAALGALSLVEAGKLSLDADVNGALKSWHVPENKFTADHKITLRLLLSHSAGFTVHGFRGYAMDEPLPTLVQVLDGKKPANSGAIRVNQTPGSQWRYSGGGYTVMQQLLIDVTGRTFPDFMRTQVLEPLGMHASTYEQPLPKDRAALAASGHYPGATVKIVPGRWHVYPEMAAAGLWTTPSDLARFAIALQDTFAGRSHPVISPAMAAQMITEQQANDGLGVFLSGERETQRFGHGGRNDGFDTELIAYLKNGQGAVIMINTNDNSRTVARIIEKISEVYGWKDYPKMAVARAPMIEDKEPEVTKQMRTIMAEIRTGSINRDLFTTPFIDAITPQLPEIAAQLQAMGELRVVYSIERKNADGHRIYSYRMVYKNETIITQCSYDQEGKIAGLTFRPE